MGNEDPWFVIGLEVILLLTIASAIFIPAKFVQLFIQDWQRRHDSQERTSFVPWIIAVSALLIVGMIYWRWLVPSDACNEIGCRWP